MSAAPAGTDIIAPMISPAPTSFLFIGLSPSFQNPQRTQTESQPSLAFPLGEHCDSCASMLFFGDTRPLQMNRRDALSTCVLAPRGALAPSWRFDSELAEAQRSR